MLTGLVQSGRPHRVGNLLQMRNLLVPPLVGSRGHQSSESMGAVGPMLDGAVLSENVIPLAMGTCPLSTVAHNPPSHCRTSEVVWPLSQVGMEALLVLCIVGLNLLLYLLLFHLGRPCHTLGPIVQALT